MIAYKLDQIHRYLNDAKLSLEKKLNFIEWNLPKPEDFKFQSNKNHILQYAKESGKNKFRLVATLNDDLMIFNWCDEQSNFIGMIQNLLYQSSDKYYIIDYTLEALDEVIDNAENFLKYCKETPNISGSPYLISSLQIMAI